MITGKQTIFRDMLKRYRIAAGLTQEALAERARLSVRGLSDLERGARRLPRADTVTLLADALALAGARRDLFVAAARAYAHPLSNVGGIGSAGHAPEAWPAPAATRDDPLYTLPVPPTPLIGRADDVAAVVGRLARQDIRLLTLTGPGGVGKTRLALQAAAELHDRFADGVRFVSLAHVRDAALVAPTIARTRGLREDGKQAAAEALKRDLRDKHMLLVLDNFEQVAPAAPIVADLLAACPRLAILATSRVAIHIQGEHEYPVAPLATPDPARLPPVEEAARYPAVALFGRHARAVEPSFTLTEVNAAAVAEICRRLDGLPLAIELAAARVKLLPPQELLARLTGSPGPAPALRLLTGGPHDLPERQRTMRAAIAWSYDLLSPDEQALFRRLGVFAGGCALEAAVVMCDETSTAEEWESAEDTTLRGLSSLVENSLLAYSGDGAAARAAAGAGDLAMEDALGEREELRFAMLETIREYALECLEVRDETLSTRRRHAEYHLALAEKLEPHLTGPRQAFYLQVLERESDNVRAALRWALERGEIDMGLRLAAALWQFWYVRGYPREGREWLERFLVIDGLDQRAAGVAGMIEAARATPAVRAKALAGAGMLAYGQGDYEQAILLSRQSVDVYRALGDARGMTVALNNLGNVAIDQGKLEEARARHEECLALRRQLDDKRGIATSLNNLGLVACDQALYEHARALHEESMAIKRALEDQRGIAISLNNLGLVARNRGDVARARSLYEESLSLFRQLGWKRGIAMALSNLAVAMRDLDKRAEALTLIEESLALRRELGDKWATAYSLTVLAGLARDQGEQGEAARLYRASLDLLEEVGNRIGLAAYLEGVAVLALARGQPARTVRLCAAADALRRALGAPLPPADRPVYEHTLAAARAALGDETYATVWAAGLLATS